MQKPLSVLAVLFLSVTAVSAADAKAGKAVYTDECKDCHGANGAPSAKVQKDLNITMKDLRSKEIQGLSDAEIKKRSIQGFGKMKPIPTITPENADNVVAYVRTLPSLKK